MNEERDKEWLKMIDNIVDAIWFETAKSTILKNTAIGIIRDITQLFTESPDVYKTNCTHYDKTRVVDGFLFRNEKERMEYYIEEALKDIKAEIKEHTIADCYNYEDTVEMQGYNRAVNDIKRLLDCKIKEHGGEA